MQWEDPRRAGAPPNSEATALQELRKRLMAKAIETLSIKLVR